MSGFRRPVAFGCAARFVIQPHGQRDTFACGVDFQHFHFHHVSGFHHFARVLDEFIGQGGDVHQAVLMDADVHKRAEVGDVRNYAFEYHADLQVVDFVNAFGKGGRLKLAARVTAGFFQLGQDVQNGRQAGSVRR